MTYKKCTHWPIDNEQLDKGIASESLMQLGYNPLNKMHIVNSANILPAMNENENHCTIQLAIAMDSVKGHL